MGTCVFREYIGCAESRLEAQKRVTQALDLPVLTGEDLVTPPQFNTYAREGALDIAAPDVNKCGGLGEMKKIATVCDVYSIPIASHTISNPLGTVAGAHLLTAVLNFLCMEWHARDVPWWNDLVVRAGETGKILKETSRYRKGRDWASSSIANWPKSPSLMAPN